jgi:hypothetical protein
MLNGNPSYAFGDTTMRVWTVILPILCMLAFPLANGAYMLLNRKDYPAWLYPITKGATTI